MKRSMSTTVPMLACLAAIAACSGSLSGSTDRPSVLATIHGTVDLMQSVSLGGSPLAVAVVWVKAPLPGSTQVASTSVAVKPTFPSSFSLDLTDVPPDSMMFDIANINCGAPPCDRPDAPPLHLRIALGALVVYEDVNRNGKLDLVAPGAPAYVDKVVGASTEIVYTEQPLPQDQNYFPIPGRDGSVLKAGYNWVREHRWDCEPSDGGWSACPPSVFYRPIDTPVTLRMFDLPKEQAAADSLMCTVVPPSGVQRPTSGSAPAASGGGPGPGVSRTTPESPADFGGPLPSSDDPELLCDGPTSFRYSENCTTTSSGVCLLYTSTCTGQVQVALAPGMAAPADWPCIPQPSF
jgi:hypothetical protein